MTKMYLNGELVDAKSARIPAESRAARFGDGVFETIPVHGGKPYLWRYHAERLHAGLDALRITPPASLYDKGLNLLKENSVQEGMLRIAISRGGASQGYLPAAYPSAEQATVIIEILPLPAAFAGPISLWLSSYEKISPRALPVQCKLSQGLNSMLARMEAADNHCDEAVQLNATGSLCEASSANLFWRKGDTLYTPSLDCGVLAGVTRQRLLELSPLPVKEGRFTLDDLQKADAVILTNAARGIVPAQTLRPLRLTWQSEAFAQELNVLRAADIKREALA